MSRDAPPARVLTERAAEETMPEPLRVYCWRHEELIRAGYPLVAATKIALRYDVDLHFACQLLERGATPAEALRILL